MTLMSRHLDFESDIATKTVLCVKTLSSYNNDIIQHRIIS